MLVLKKLILSYDTSFHRIIKSRAGNLRISVLDTDTGEMMDSIYASEVLDKDVLGIITDNEYVIFLVISEATWGILKLRDKIEETIWDSSLMEDAIPLPSGRRKVTMFDTGDNTVAFIFLSEIVRSVDEEYIFWRTGLMYFTIYDTYEMIFSRLEHFNDGMIVYIVSSDAVSYKFRLNKKLIRYMTKVKVLC